MPAVVVSVNGKAANVGSKVLQFAAEGFEGSWVAGNKITDQHDEVDLFVIDRFDGPADQVVVTEIVMMKISHYRDLHSVEVGMSD